MTRRPGEALSVTLVSTERAAELLGVSARTLTRMVADTPDVQAPRVDVGTGSRRVWRWDPTRLLEWATARDEWRNAPKPADRPNATSRRSALDSASPPAPYQPGKPGRLSLLAKELTAREEERKARERDRRKG